MYYLSAEHGCNNFSSWVHVISKENLWRMNNKAKFYFIYSLRSVLLFIQNRVSHRNSSVGKNMNFIIKINKCK